jgi:hypothetical protein
MAVSCPHVLVAPPDVRGLSKTWGRTVARWVFEYTLGTARVGQWKATARVLSMRAAVSPVITRNFVLMTVVVSFASPASVAIVVSSVLKVALVIPRTFGSSVDA